MRAITMRTTITLFVSTVSLTFMTPAFCQEPSPDVEAGPQLSAPQDTTDASNPRTRSTRNETSVAPPESAQPNAATMLEQTEIQKLEEQWENDVYRWTLSEQFNWAQQVIRDYPDSDLADRAQRIIEDYQRFTPAAEARRRLALERTRAVRAYWRPQHQQWGQAVQRWEAARNRRDVTLTNTQPGPLEGGVTVLFEIRLPGTRWCGPYRLPGGRSSRFFSQVEIRYIDPGNPDQMITQTLAPNTDWIFVPEGERLRLVPAN